MIALVLAACSSAAAPAGPLPFGLVKVGPAEMPTAVVVPAAGPEGVWVTEQVGRVVDVATGSTRVVLDVRDRVTAGGERGLLGLALAPGWPADPRAFVNYTYVDGDALHTRIASFRSGDGGRTLDPASERTILTFAQPYSNHNSGALAFGPDGMLYAGVGDGGSGGDPHGTGQDRSDFLGSILRLDVAKEPYVVPPDNPFVGEAGVRPEVWAYGLRNPWGMHFDGATLWWADVGQNKWEEIDRGVAGGNYGWNQTEGAHCYTRGCDVGAYVAPVAEYGHDEGASVTGGLVVRDARVPALDGKYVFADFATGRFFAVPAAGGPVQRLGGSELNPSAFGRGRDGTVYVADYRGAVYRVTAPSP